MVPDLTGNGTKMPDDIFRILCCSIPGAVYLCANDERYTMSFLTDAVFGLVGYPASDFLEDRISFVELFHPNDAKRIPKEVGAALERREPFHLVYRLKHAEGHWVWMEEWGQGIFDDQGEVQFLQGTIFDITARKHAEEVLQRASDDLETRVAERTAELARANEQLRRDQETSRAMLEKYERQHRLLAYEIHDGMVQYATASLMHLEAAKIHQKTMTPKAREACEKAQRLMSDTIREGRRVISGLRPPVLDELGIVAAIEYLLHEEPWPEGMQIDLDLPSETLRISPDLGTSLFRIAQEAIHNVLQHSQSMQIAISLTAEKGILRLEVSDSGVGFTTGSEPYESFGLRGIRERVKIHGGKIEIKSSPGQGTRLKVELPMGKYPAGS